MLLILGHPSKNSFSKALMDAYAKELYAKSEVEVKEIYLGDLDFDPILHEGYNEIQQLEPDLVKVQELIKWADYICFFYPIWWGGMPALMKGFFDRAILPGFAFKYHNKNPIPKRLLKGKRAQIFVTMGMPPILYKILGAPHFRMMKRFVLAFCGIKLKRITALGPIMNHSSEKSRNKMLKKVEQLGRRFK